MCSALITSVFFVPILSGLGAIQLAQEPDGILALAGQQKLRRKREKARLARIAAAEAEVHGGAVPEHERHHRTEESAERSELAAIHGRQVALERADDAAFALRRDRRRLRRRRGPPRRRPAASTAAG